MIANVLFAVPILWFTEGSGGRPWRIGEYINDACDPNNQKLQQALVSQMGFKGYVADARSWISEKSLIDTRPDGVRNIGVFGLARMNQRIKYRLNSNLRKILDPASGLVDIDTAEKYFEVVYDPSGPPPMKDMVVLNEAITRALVESSKTILQKSGPLIDENREFKNRAAKRGMKHLLKPLPALLVLERSLVCSMFRVDHRPHIFNRLHTTQFHTTIHVGLFARIITERDDPLVQMNRNLGDIESSVLNISPRTFVNLETDLGGAEPRIDKISPIILENPSPVRESTSGETFDVEKFMSTKVLKAPEFRCPQEDVLRPHGYSSHCVHLGARRPTFPLNPIEDFALKCTGLYPKGSLFVARKHKIYLTPSGHHTVESHWIYRECFQATGWGPENKLTDKIGQNVHDLCKQNHFEFIDPRELLKSAGTLSSEVPRRF